MERVEKTVFLSYRRTNVPWALAIFQNLTQHGYDVFMDYSGIAGGDFESVILALEWLACSHPHNTVKQRSCRIAGSLARNRLTLNLARFQCDPHPPC